MNNLVLVQTISKLLCFKPLFTTVLSLLKRVRQILWSLNTSRELKVLVVHVTLDDNTLQGLSVVLDLKPVRLCVYNSYEIYDPSIDLSLRFAAGIQFTLK